MATGDVAGAWSECATWWSRGAARSAARSTSTWRRSAPARCPWKTARCRCSPPPRGRPMHKVEVDVKRLGGGFGGKEDQATHWAAMAALAAAHLDAPVELVLNRLDDIRMTGKRHPYSADFRIGLTTDGKILAYEATFYQNSGAFADLSPPVLARTLFHATNAYFIPNVRVTAAPCRTKPAAAHRLPRLRRPAGDVRDRGGHQQGGRRDGDRGVRDPARQPAARRRRLSLRTEGGGKPCGADLGRARVGVRRGRDPTAGVGVQPRQLRVQEGAPWSTSMPTAA